MKHDKCMEEDAEYKMVYELMSKNNIRLETILDVVVKSNGLVGVGVVSLKDGINAHLDGLMKGY